jgi:hypothetical protein
LVFNLVYKARQLVHSDCEDSCLSLGISVISASVVSKRPALEAAFCKAAITTLAGSMMPACIIFQLIPLILKRIFIIAVCWSK